MIRLIYEHKNRWIMSDYYQVVYNNEDTLAYIFVWHPEKEYTLVKNYTLDKYKNLIEKREEEIYKMFEEWLKPEGYKRRGNNI